MSTGAKQVQISEDELAELYKLRDANSQKKAKSQGRSKARNELIRLHKGEYDGLLKRYIDAAS